MFWGRNGKPKNIYQLNLLKTYDLALVFNGENDRIAPAIDLICKGKAKKIIISPATKFQMDSYIKKYAKGERIHYVLEPNARTTHENAFYCSEIIIHEKANNIILITSFYHMNRSHRLLSLALRDHRQCSGGSAWE